MFRLIRIIIILALLGAVGWGVYLLKFNYIDALDIDVLAKPSSPKSTVVVKGETLKVDVARTPGQRARGLSGRESLAANEGMWFVFDRAEMYTFWMKGMKFSIDIIWVNDGKVVDVTPNVPVPGQDTGLSELPRYSPSEPAQYVLEVNAGFAQAHGIRKGESVGFEEKE